VVAYSQADADPSFGRQLDNELIALLGERRRRDHAAIQDDRFTGSSVDFGRCARPVQYTEKRAAKQKD
jgi:hypothetical protein